VTTGIRVNELAFENIVYPNNGTVSILQDPEGISIVTTTTYFNKAVVDPMLIAAGLFLVVGLFFLLRFLSDNTAHKILEKAGMTEQMYQTYEAEVTPVFEDSEESKPLEEPVSWEDKL
jgi:hypothetical protein